MIGRAKKREIWLYRGMTLFGKTRQHYSSDVIYTATSKFVYWATRVRQMRTLIQLFVCLYIEHRTLSVFEHLPWTVSKEWFFVSSLTPLLERQWHGPDSLKTIFELVAIKITCRKLGSKLVNLKEIGCNNTGMDASDVGPYTFSVAMEIFYWVTPSLAVWMHILGCFDFQCQTSMWSVMHQFRLTYRFIYHWHGSLDY
jgi:hypothetical protein